MKKGLVYLLVLVMSLSLCACGSGSDSSTGANNGGAEVNTEPSEPSVGSIIKNAEFQYPSSNELFKYNVYDTYIEITEYIGDDAAAELVVPATLEELPVYVIDHNVFSKCGVKSIVFEDGIYMIHSDFSSTVESVTLPATLDYVGSGTFEMCYSLKTVVIPEGIDSIQYKAFKDCHALEEITIPSTVWTINSETFVNCFNLKTVNLPEGLTSIDDGAFTSCTSLKTIVLPSTLEKMGSDVFLSSGLESIEIPESVTKIGSGMFSGCENLKIVKVYNAEMEIEPVEGSTVAIMFSNCPEDLVVHGKAGSTIAKQCGQENILFQVIK